MRARACAPGGANASWLDLRACDRAVRGRRDCAQGIGTSWPDSKATLERLRSELELSLDKLVTREKFLNDQFDTLMSQYRAVRGQMQGVQVGVAVGF